MPRSRPCLIVARVAGVSGALPFALNCGAATVAVAFALEDGGVVDEPIDAGECHGGIGEDLAPLAEGLVCGDEDIHKAYRERDDQARESLKICPRRT